ncbi:MAG: DUF5060 domain-containing protein [Chloroflexi bacterium]|nr:DUF5060 domain-containing protein [Chloroflexota bacterium]
MSLQTCPQYHPHDVIVRSEASHANPFLVDLRARITGPHGWSTTVPGFYDGDGTWVVRFCPSAFGAWRYETESTDPALAGHDGEVQCIANANPRVHGALLVDPAHPHHFLYEDGTWPFVLGYEANWLWALGFLEDGEAQLRRFCERIASYGYNHIFVNTYAHDTRWAPGKSHAEDYGPPPMYAWGGTNEAPDHLRLNVAYWRNFDVMMRALIDHGLTAHLYLKVYNKEVNWPRARSLADDLFFRYVVARYQGYSNVVWDFSKESYNETDKAYCENRLSFIKAHDGYRRLVTAHDDWALHFDQRFGGALDFVTDQKHDHFAERVIQLRRQLRPCPVINEEFAYECGPGGVEDLSYHPRVRHTPEEHVLRSWEVVFGGGYPGYYYLYTAWDVVRPDDLPPGYALHKRLAGFMKATAWWELEPHPEVVERSTARCLAKVGREYLIFNRAEHGPQRHFDERTQAMITLPGLPPGAVLAADWLQPLTGRRAQTQVQVRPRFSLVPPFEGPYVVRLR